MLEEIEIGGRRRWARSDAGRLIRAAGRLGTQLAFGNVASFQDNRDIRRPRTSWEVERLRTEGWLRFKQTIDPATIARVRAVIDERVDDPDRTSDGGEPPRSDSVRVLNDISDILPELRELLAPAVRRVVEAYYGMSFEVEIARLYRTISVSTDEARTNVMGNFFHLDPEPISTLKYFVQLSDVSHEAAFRVFPIPVTRRIVRSGYIYPGRAVGPAARRLSVEAGAVFFDDEPGSGILCNTQLMLHRAGVPAPGEHRDIVQFRLRPSSYPLRADWTPLAVDD